MRQRTIGMGLVAASLVAGGVVLGISRSGVVASARELRQTVMDARKAGLEPDANLLVAREKTHPRDEAKRKYHRALLRFRDGIPKGLTARKMTPQQRAQYRPETERLIPLSLAAEGATGRYWRWGYYVEPTEREGYREATNLLLSDSLDALKSGRIDQAISDLEKAERLGHGLSGTRDITTEITLSGGALRIGRGIAAVLAQPKLSRPQLIRLAGITRGKTFEHGDDLLILSHELASAWATVDVLINSSPAKTIRLKDPVDRYGSLGRVPTVRAAWLQSITRPYADVAQALPKDWTRFEEYKAAYAIFGRKTYQRRTFATNFSRALVPEDGLLGEVQMAREAVRRVLDTAIQIRLGEKVTPPRDPFGPGPLKIVMKGKRLLIYSLFPNGKDDGGTPSRGVSTGDFVASIPR